MENSFRCCINCKYSEKSVIPKQMYCTVMDMLFDESICCNWYKYTSKVIAEEGNNYE